MSRLTMRYLLIFHSSTTGEWRCLDSAQLHPQGIGQIAELTDVLNAQPDVTLVWMMGRRRFGAFSAAVGPSDEGTEWVRVYALDPDRPVMGQGNEYHGPSLEVLMQQDQPLGWIAARRVADAFVSLEQRLADPFRASNETCQQTLTLMREAREVAPREELSSVQPEPSEEPVKV